METVILDVGGNLCSLVQAIDRAGCKVSVTRDPERVAAADRLLLPGQGQFGQVASYLEDPELRAAVITACDSRPVLAICVGMQLLFAGSKEAPEAHGLGLIEGVVRRLPLEVRAPHMGWNAVNNPLLPGDYYFAHSYWCDPVCNDVVVGWVDYGVRLPAIVRYQQTIGVQFHPEKSGVLGARLIEQFLEGALC